MDNSPAAAWIADPKTDRMEYASQSYRRLFQVPPGSIIGLTVDKLYPPDIAQIYIQNTQQVAATGQVLEVVEPGILADGRLGEFLVLKFPLLQSDGRMMVGGVAVDITDRKRAEAERLQAKKLRIELSLLENILDTILAGYWDADLVHGQQYISPGFKQMFGYEDHELPNSPDTWKQLVFPEDLPKALDNYSQHVQSHGKIPYY